MNTSDHIRVLIADDSSFMRKALEYILSSESSIEVVSTAVDGKDALKKVKLYKPDAVLLDINMPYMDGLTALSRIMDECPTPTVMLSGIKEADISIKSLELGAVDFIQKPSGIISYDIDRIRTEIVSKVKAAASVDIRNMPSDINVKKRCLHLNPAKTMKKEIVVIGASTGGPRAIISVLSELSEDIPAAIIVVQHMGTDFIPSFVERLKLVSSLNISIAQEDEIIRSGQVFIAPGGCHTSIVKDGKIKKIQLLLDMDRESYICPSIDYTMDSAAKAYGTAAVGVLLTGMGGDGAKGMKAIKNAGGNTIAEDETTCIVFGMPKSAIELGIVDEVVPLPQIPEVIMKLL